MLLHRSLTVLTFGALVGAATLPASAQPAVTVVVNGSPVAFDQPPIERAGRVYVPLRGVFERLGASVVYENGTINATEGRRAVSLQIGSTNALVGGRSVQLDSPPFLVGARTLVPLRFISQALGASVNYVQSTETVYVNGARAQALGPRPVAPPEAGSATIAFWRMEPAEGVSVASGRPEISASFGQRVDPSSVRIIIDGRDVTGNAYVSTRSFSFEPGYDIPPGRHRVVVTGESRGAPFRVAWAFESAAAASPNYIRSLSPRNGGFVGHTFVVTGETRPQSHLHIVAVASSGDRSFSDVRTGSAVDDLTADSSGYFSARIRLDDLGAGVVDVRVQSTAPDGGVAIRTLRLAPGP